GVASRIVLDEQRRALSACFRSVRRSVRAARRAGSNGRSDGRSSRVPRRRIERNDVAVPNGIGAEVRVCRNLSLLISRQRLHPRKRLVGAPPGDGSEGGRVYLACIPAASARRISSDRLRAPVLSMTRERWISTVRGLIARS